MSYNGWSNYATWNVAMSLGNDHDLHHALEHYANEAPNPTYKGFIAGVGLLDKQTADGVGWFSEDLDFEELDGMVADHKEEEDYLPSDHLPFDLARKVYKTKDLIAMLKGLEKAGYSGLGLGLIVDLIERDVPECN